MGLSAACHSRSEQGPILARALLLAPSYWLFPNTPAPAVSEALAGSLKTRQGLSQTSISAGPFPSNLTLELTASSQAPTGLALPRYSVHNAVPTLMEMTGEGDSPQTHQQITQQVIRRKSA